MRFVIYGTGGLGRETLQVARDCQLAGESVEPVGFLDERSHLHGTLLAELPVLGGMSWLRDAPDVGVFVAIGSSAVRRRVVLELSALRPFSSPTLVHPSAVVGRSVTLGHGTLLCPRTVATTDIRVGNHVVINPGSTLSHDAVIEDFVTLACGVHLSGSAHVGEGADVGTGTNVIQGIQVGAWSVLGAGAAVVRDVPANSTAVGCPARVIKQRAAGWHL